MFTPTTLYWCCPDCGHNFWRTASGGTGYSHTCPFNPGVVTVVPPPANHKLDLELIDYAKMKYNLKFMIDELDFDKITGVYNYTALFCSKPTVVMKYDEPTGETYWETAI
jgi:hypothetical protein